MKYHTYLLVVLMAGLISIFATCKKTPVSSAHSHQDSIKSADLPILEDPEIVEKPLEDDDEEYFSQKSSNFYSFKRSEGNLLENYFREPFDSAILVSGTFCELRGNHFHGGLDIRTGGVQGWPVLAAAQGYVQRVVVSTKGYGKVVYIKHPNGYTSVYGHLQNFTGALALVVKEAQYKQKSFELDLSLKPSDVKLNKGQNFALSGNTGGSGGPHLHFEIRNPSGLATNPLLYGLKVEDNSKPRILDIAILRKDEALLQSHGHFPYTIIDRSKMANTYQKVAPGNYGLALNTVDYFTDTKNRLGINYCWVTANGHLLYEYRIEKMDFNEGRFINTHVDPYIRFRTGKSFVRLFKEAYNPLRYYRQKNNGHLFLALKDTLEIKIYVQDFKGFTDSVAFNMVGGEVPVLAPFPIPPYQESKIVKPGANNNISIGEWRISIPPKAIYHQTDFLLSELPPKPQMLSNTLQLHYPYTPLHSYIFLSYPVPKSWEVASSKLCAISFDGSKKTYEGGAVQDGIFKFKTRSLGQYAITKDITPPKIKKIMLGKSFRFSLSDDLCGIKEIKCLLDDRWILYDFEPKIGAVWGEIPAWIKPGKYKFTMVVSDFVGNVATFEQDLTL